MNVSVSVLEDKLADFMSVVSDLARAGDLFVGVPEDKAARDGKINNATLAAIHNAGSPAQNIPARPFLTQGIDKCKKDVTDILAAGARSSLDKLDSEELTKAQTKAGLTAQNAVKGEFRSGGLEPLKAPRRGREGRKQTSTTPLVDTGSLRNSIGFVVR